MNKKYGEGYKKKHKSDKEKGIIGFVKLTEIVYTVIKTEIQLHPDTIILKCSLRKYNSTYILTLGIRVSQPMSGLLEEEDRSRNRVPPYLR